jgi:hypothetical protein
MSKLLYAMGLSAPPVDAFATASSLWSQLASRYLTMVRTEQDGTFRAAGLPPGQYYVAAVDRLPEGEWQDPDVLDSLVPRATILTPTGRNTTHRAIALCPQF